MKLLFVLLAATCLLSCDDNSREATAKYTADSSAVVRDSNAIINATDSLPAPFASKSVKNYSRVTGWPASKMPAAPEGFIVSRFASGLDNPRWIYQSPNGDVFISQANTEVSGIKKIGVKFSRVGKSQKLGTSSNSILLFRDVDKDGLYEKKYVFAQNLNRPFGMLVSGNYFYIANTDALDRFDYKAGDTALRGPARTILSLPGGGYNNHWTRNIIAGHGSDKIYVSVGSGSNVAEHGIENERRRANILTVNPDGTGEKIYASGLRNPAGMDWEPQSGKLWVAVNERDELGDELVPDFITSVQEGGFYGWPYAYFGKHPDPRLKDDPHPEMVARSIVPDLGLGSHTASLGFTFYTKSLFPPAYRGGAFVGQHGSWNKSVLAGYRVLFVPFANGKPAGKPSDFLTGFIADSAKQEVYGRPVGTAVLQDGTLLVADDAGNTIWQVSYRK